MRVENLHGWQVSIAQARDIQQKLSAMVLKSSELSAPRYIAGADIAVGKTKDSAQAAVVVLEYPQLRLVETKVVKGRLDFPYVPGLLSFRESPLTLAAFESLVTVPDLVLVDGQGLAHPRRLGYASHLGLFLNKPTIGCAKSLLLGQCEAPGDQPGDYTEIVDRGEVIGAALRTKSGVNPVYVSIGHKVDLQIAIYWVLQCCRGHRIPEPLRLAHLAAGGDLVSTGSAVTPEESYRGKLFD